MRDILDDVEPEQISVAFSSIVNQLKEEGKLDEYLFMGKYYLVSIDGTGEFSSNSISCENCCTKTDDEGNVVSYYHQLLSAVIVHPNKQQVIPIAVEPIIKEQDQTKNDCERNASKRLLRDLKATYPDFPFVIIEDGLASNAPHIKLLKELGFHFILGVKEGDHKYLFDQVQDAMHNGLTGEFNYENEDGSHKGYRILNNVPLNQSNQDVKVNYLEYSESDSSENLTKYFTRVTDFELEEDNAEVISEGGRARWKIENETFNTLKNQGYNLEHNYGHGAKHLSTVFMILTVLAFLIDQTQELCSEIFQAARRKFKSRTSLWSKISSLFTSYYIKDWKTLWDSIIYSYKIKMLEPEIIDTS